MGGGLEGLCVARVFGADGAVGLARHHPHRTRYHHAPRHISGLGVVTADVTNTLVDVDSKDNCFIVIPVTYIFIILFNDQQMWK